MSELSPTQALAKMLLDIENTIDKNVKELRNELEEGTPVYTGQMKESWEEEHWDTWKWTIDNLAEDEDGFYASWVFMGQSKSRWPGMAVVHRADEQIQQDLRNLGVY